MSHEVDLHADTEVDAVDGARVKINFMGLESPKYILKDEVGSTHSMQRTGSTRSLDGIAVMKSEDVGARSNSTQSAPAVVCNPVELMDLASVAVEERRVSFAQGKIPELEDVRENIRVMHAYSRRIFPEVCHRSTAAFLGRKEVNLILDTDYLRWKRKERTRGEIVTDDIVAATQMIGKETTFQIHYYRRGKGKGAKALKRKYHIKKFRAKNVAECKKWVNAIQELVRWQARVPSTLHKRKIKVVVNPHSGKKRASQIWHEKIKPMLDMCDFESHVELTTYSKHATDMGRNFSAKENFEAIVFVSGDGTICEYMNGLLERPEEEWREIVHSTPLSLISAGSQNAFGQGLGISTIEAAVYCIIKRKLRPLDVVTAVADHQKDTVLYSCCGLGWGIAGDIAEASEKHRCLGTYRYAYLKVKLGALMRKKHSGTIKYVPVDPQPVLRTYDEIKNIGADDQHSTEHGDIYESQAATAARATAAAAAAAALDNAPLRQWEGASDAVRNPASLDRYPADAWKEITGEFIAAGVLNTVPDGKFTHPSDGAVDLIVGRKGKASTMAKLGIYYLLGKELQSPLLSYIKVKAVIIEQNEKQNVMNIDGEVFSGPGPWRMEVIPSLFKVLSEK